MAFFCIAMIWLYACTVLVWVIEKVSEKKNRRVKFVDMRGKK